MTQHYLLELLENAAGDEFRTQHIIEAEDRQMVKYHFHRTLKDWGYRDTQFGKHCLKSGRGSGLFAEIAGIHELDRVEANVLEQYIDIWTKV